MTADRFSLKARRTTRIPLRIPVLVVHQQEGQTRSVDGWTMIVNIHGAKIESKHPFALNEEVTVQVPFNGMSQQGKVVWARTEMNEKGNREFGVELNEPENLWGVGFPPSDWEAGRNAKAAAGSSAILDLAPEGVQIAKNTAPETSLSPRVAEPATASPVQAAAPIGAPMPSPIASPVARPHAGSAAPAILEIEPVAAPALAREIDQVLEIDPKPEAVPVSEVALGHLERNHTEALPPKEEKISMHTEISMEEIMRQHDAAGASAPSAAPAPPAAAPRSAASSNPTDRLSAFFHELVDSALETKLQTIVEGVSGRVAARVSEIEASTMARLEQQAQATGTRQIEELEQRTAERVQARQQAVLTGVGTFLDEAESGFRRRQQEFLENNLALAQQHTDALLEAGAERLQQDAENLVSASQQGLRAGVEQMLPAIQQESLERCRVVGERLMSAQLEQWLLLFSDRVKQNEQAIEQRLDATLDALIARHASAASARFEELEAAAGARVEQQLQRIGTQVRQTFLRHVVTELGRGQQVWLEQAERRIERIAAAQLERVRQDFSAMVRQFADALLQQAQPLLQREQPALDFPGAAELSAADLTAVMHGFAEMES